MTGKCVAIVREANNKWEHRTGSAPVHVHQLVQQGIRVLVQPSVARIFSDEQYVRATASNDLTAADVIVSVKQVPEPVLLADKTHFFST